MNTYYIEAARHEKNEYRVECDKFRSEYGTNIQPELPAYQQMVQWMKSQLQASPDGKLPVHKLTPEYNPEREMNITSHETTLRGPDYRVVPDNEVILNADEPFQEVKPAIPYEAKGYDLFEDAYFFATVDTWRTVKPYRAESPEQALQMAKGDQLHNVLTRVQPVRQFLHADKFEKVTLYTGQTVDIIGEKEMAERLRQKFPDGLTVRLADESFANLARLKNWNDLSAEQFDDWMGLGNPGDNRLLVAHGDIPAELKLMPEDYKHVYACEETYYDEELNDLIEDEGIAATSLLLANERKLEAFRVKIPQFEQMLDKLYIAGKPYRTMMEMAQDHGVKNDRDFMHMLDKIYLYDQPDWIKELAKKQTMEQRHKAFINITAKPVGEYHQAYGRLLEDTARKMNVTVADLERYIKQPATVPMQLREGMFHAMAQIQKEILPFETAQNRAFHQYNQTALMLEADFARRFNDFIDKKVRNVTQYPNNQGKWNVRLQIDGVQQMGRPIDDKDARARRDRKGLFNSVKTMACKYFKDEIVAAMNGGQQQERTRGITR